MEHEYERYDPTQRYRPNRHLSMISGAASFPLLELILDPTRAPPPLLRDAILVSIDLEYRNNEPRGKTQITQVGIASLDTRVLGGVDPADSRSLVGAIQCRVFDIHPKRQAVSKRKAWVPKCMWATPEVIRHDEICDKLREIFAVETKSAEASTTSYKETPRNIVLIGHGIWSDRSLLLRLFGFDIKSVPTIRAILDTGRMVCSAYDFGIATHSHFPLRMILRCLGVRYDQLHNAGNDAMFTMKALLLMFSNWKCCKGKYLWNIAEDIVVDDSSSCRLMSSVAQDLLWDCQLEVLTAIARESWPGLKQPAVRRSTVLVRPAKAQTNILSLSGDLALTQMFG